jgi:diguanylate cyclase (GGDEF)-like protein/PAS domain S-box-containing protein
MCVPKVRWRQGRADHRRAEEARRLVAIVESAADAIIAKDLNGTILSWNTGAEHLYGYSSFEVLGRNISLLVPPDHANEIPEILQRIKRGERIEQYETVRCRKDGKTVDVSIMISPVYEGGGAIVGASTIARDISGRRRTEAQTRTRLRSIFDSALDAVVTMDADGVITDWNLMAETVFGWPRSEAVGRLVVETIIPHRYREPHKLGLRHFLASGDGPALNKRLELAALHRDGHEFPIELSISATLSGTSHVFSAFVRDITERHRAEQALRRLAATVATSSDAIIAADLNGTIMNWNAGASRMYGYAAEDMIGRSLSIIVPEDRSDELRAALDRVNRGEQIEQLETVRRRRDGSLVEVSISLAPLTDAHGTVIATTGIARDMGSAKQAALALRASEERYRRIVETAFEGVWIIDSNNRTTFVNRRMADMLGYAPEEMLGKPVLTFMDPDAQAAFVANRDRRQQAHQAEHEFRFKRKDGSELWVLLEASPDQDAAGNYLGSLAMVTDVTERRRAQKAFEHQALHDALTGLPNRLLLTERLAQALASALADQRQVAVLVLDMDHLKEVNETFGLQAGDRLLEQVGPRLQSEIRAEDMVARLGGDEFAVLLRDTDATAAATVAAQLLDALERPFEVEGQPLDAAPSIGIAIFPNDGDDPDTLLRRADSALFVAKKARGSVVRYVPEHEQGASRLTLMAELQEALHQGQLFLEFQPLVRLRDRSLAGVEALVRWRHPQRGLVPPLEFVPFAEKTRLIQPLTRWVLVSALRQCVAWHRGGHPIRVSVNISMRDLVDPGFPQLIARLLRDAEAQPSWLLLEITEGVIMAEPERAINTLSQLRKLGVRLAVDDFGTGYSSLAYLHRLPIHEIKIDKSFVAAMAGAANRANIVRASIELGHNLGLESVAEGVEGARTWDLLVALACDLAQGYFISRPMLADEVLPWLSQWENAPAESADQGADQAA